MIALRRIALATILVVFCLSSDGIWRGVFSAASDGAPSAIDDHRAMLEALGHRVLVAIRRGDVESLISVLGDPVALGPDDGMTRRKLTAALRKREGRVYAMLFDTRAHREIARKNAEKYFHEEVRRQLPPVFSVQEVLQRARDVSVEVEFMVGSRETPPELAVVRFEWPGRPEYSEFGNLGFMWKGGRWRLSHLFSMTSRGVLAPWIKP